MRLAVLSDIHGNLHALEAVLEHAQQQQPDQIVIAGDLINYLPDSKACWDLAMSLNLALLRGNHERYIFHYDTADAEPSWYSERFQILPWTVKQFSSMERQTIAHLPLALHFDDLLIVHATFHDDHVTITPETPQAELHEMFAGSSQSFIIRGHNHHPFSHGFDGRVLESIGSAGLPLDGTPEAKYLIAEKHKKGWTFLRQQVSYDVAAAIKRFAETGFLEAGGPIARLALLELQTSCNHLMPFLTAYARWSQNETLSLSQAVDAYLASQ